MDKTQKIATGLGWFSIGLGLAEMIGPNRLTRMLGVGRHTKMVRGFGLREIAAGVGILTRKAERRTPYLWARVAGDAVDLGALFAALKGNRKKRVAAAIANVAAVTALDVFCAAKMSRASA